jgi:polar amino acid transport system substrate-binding protein
VPVDAARCHRLCVTFVLAGGIVMSLSVRPTPFRVVATASLAIAAAALAGCAPADGGGSSSTTSGSAAGSPSASASASATCSKDSLKTHTSGKLTVATDKPVYEPWFVDDKPENGKGFESAVAYAVAQKLGFAQGDVDWTRVGFNSVIQPGPKNFDFDINEVSITDARKKAVDFSSGYYDVTQAIITTKGSKIANAKSIADLKNAKIGAQVGTTSYDTIKNVIKPSGDPAVFNTNDDANKALGNGQIDGLVVDLPTAFYITGSGQVKDSQIVGQFANTGGTPEQFGLVLDKGSALTSCVSQAVDALRSAGTLKQLEQQWLSQTAGAPVLQ